MLLERYRVERQIVGAGIVRELVWAVVNERNRFIEAFATEAEAVAEAKALTIAAIRERGVGDSAR